MSDSFATSWTVACQGPLSIWWPKQGPVYSKGSWWLTGKSEHKAWTQDTWPGSKFWLCPSGQPQDSPSVDFLWGDWGRPSYERGLVASPYSYSSPRLSWGISVLENALYPARETGWAAGDLQLNDSSVQRGVRSQAETSEPVRWWREWAICCPGSPGSKLYPESIEATFLLPGRLSGLYLSSSTDWLERNCLDTELEQQTP